MKSRSIEERFLIGKRDIISGFLAQIVQPLSIILILPFLLKTLTSNEIGLNFLMGTVAGLVTLLDFGFSTQFSRNFTYVFAGSQSLFKEGFHENKSHNGDIEYNLLATLIQAAKFVYLRIASIAFFLMLFLGTSYVYFVTHGFKDVNNCFSIWILFSASTFLNLYFSYYQCLLRGKGLIKEINNITVLARLLQVLVMYILLYLGFGLISVSISGFIYPLVLRKMAKNSFFDSEFELKIGHQTIDKSRIIDVIQTIWFNARKLGLVFIGSYLISRVGLFISGFFLSLSEVATYGLLLQIFTFVVGLSSAYFSVFQTRLNFLRIKGSTIEIMHEFSFSMLIFYSLFIIGTVGVIFLAPILLSLIDSKVALPQTEIILLYSLVLLLEQNHSNFAMLISSGNKIPFVKPSLLSGVSILIGIIIWFVFINRSIWGLIIIPGVVQLLYNNWKWPKVVFQEFEITTLKYFQLIYGQTSRLKNMVVMFFLNKLR